MPDLIRRLSVGDLVQTNYPLLADPAHAGQSSVFALARRSTDIPLVVVKKLRKQEHYRDEVDRLTNVPLCPRPNMASS